MLPATSASPSAATSRAMPQGVAVERLEVVLAADRAQLVAVAVVGERDHHVGAGAQHLPVQPANGVGEVEHHLGDERPGLQEAAALELEQVALGADDDAVVEPLAQPPCRSRAARPSAPAGRTRSRPRCGTPSHARARRGPRSPADRRSDTVAGSCSSRSSIAGSPMRTRRIASADPRADARATVALSLRSRRSRSRRPVRPTEGRAPPPGPRRRSDPRSARPTSR